MNPELRSKAQSQAETVANDESRLARTTDKGPQPLLVKPKSGWGKIQSNPLIACNENRGVNEGVGRRFKSGHWLQFYRFG